MQAGAVCECRQVLHVRVKWCWKVLSVSKMQAAAQAYLAMCKGANAAEQSSMLHTRAYLLGSATRTPATGACGKGPRASTATSVLGRVKRGS